MQSEFTEKNCVVHGNKASVYECVECGRDYCSACLTMVEGEPFCEICWERNLATLAPKPDPNVTYTPSVPWQNWRRLGVWNAFWETAIQPRVFFSKIHAQVGIGAALFFALVCVLFLWYPMNVIYVKLLIPPMLNTITQQAAENPSSVAMAEEMRGRIESITSLDLLAMPLLFIINYLVFSSLIQQMMIRMMQGKQGYSATLQIRCYAMISQIFLLIPFLGFFLAELSTLVICTQGFQSAQGLSRARALLVALVPAMISLIGLPFSI
ncbi:MAG: YIP1 family protein [Candidatus Hinthialibacter antarcticus]|nr:YIP1 family protein [Candidatus Hinthialibacter antarcticus]